MAALALGVLITDVTVVVSRSRSDVSQTQPDGNVAEGGPTTTSTAAAPVPLTIDDRLTQSPADFDFMPSPEFPKPQALDRTQSAAELAFQNEERASIQRGVLESAGFTEGRKMVWVDAADPPRVTVILWGFVVKDAPSATVVHEIWRRGVTDGRSGAEEPLTIAAVPDATGFQRALKDGTGTAAMVELARENRVWRVLVLFREGAPFDPALVEAVVADQAAIG